MITYNYFNTPTDPARHGKLQSITENSTAGNAITTYGYDARGNVNQVTDPAGRVTRYWYDFNDRVTAVMTTDPDSTGNLLPVLQRFDYDVFGNVIATELVNSRWQNNRLEVTAVVTSYTYDAANRLQSEITQSPNIQWYWTLSGADIVRSQTVPTLSSTITEATLVSYAAANSRIVNTPASNSLWRGLLTQYSYFQSSNEVQVTVSNNGSDPRVSRMEYDRLNRIVRSITPNPVTGYTAVSGAQLDNGGLVTRYAYDNLSNIVSTTDALNNVSTVQYDDLNRPIAIGTPHPTTVGSTLNTTIAYTPTLRGWSIQSTNPLGNTTIAQSDMLGRTTRVSGSAISTQSWDYWMDGRVRTTIDELGRATDFTYDQRGRLLSHQAPAPTVGANRPTTSFTYSIDSLLTATTDPMGRVTSYEYDNGGRVSRVVAPDPDGAGAQVASYQQFVRDSVGNVLRHTDRINEATGHWTVNTYDAWFRLLTSTDEQNAVTSTVYDVFGNVTRVTDAKSNNTDYTYNKLNQLVTENKGTNRTYSYDANGNLRSYTDRNNRTTTFQYDFRNRLTSEAWGTTRTLTYSYDVGDRLTGILDSDPLSIDFQFAYDTRNQLQAERQYGSIFLLGRSVLFDRNYDSVGNLTQLRANINGTISGETVTGGIDDFVNTHSYDAMNRRVQTTQTGTATGNAIAPKTAAMQYNAASQVTDIRRYNAVSPVATSLRVHTRNDFDNAGRLAGVTHARQELASGVVWNGLSNTSSVGIVAAYRFAYDSDNRLTQFSSFADNLRTNYTYDRVDQLTGTSTSIITGMVAPFIPTNEAYSYDATGN
ncbi:MAG: hypothetical protein ACK52I_32475, partial [Pseudomonadota bacterium]